MVDIVLKREVGEKDRFEDIPAGVGLKSIESGYSIEAWTAIIPCSV